MLPLQNQVGRSAGYLVERLPAYRTGGVDTEIRGYTGLQMLYIETRTGLYVGRQTGGREGGLNGSWLFIVLNG